MRTGSVAERLRSKRGIIGGTTGVSNEEGVKVPEFVRIRRRAARYTTRPRAPRGAVTLPISPMTEPFAILAPELPPPGTASWQAITAPYPNDEAQTLAPLLEAATFPAS